MIKIDKDLAKIPESLVPAFVDFFPNVPNIPLIPINTHQKRMTLIESQKYIDEAPFNEMYKRDDIKNALNNIYKNKCAYCEEKVEQLHVEHYRPKKIYYWLAFSWDNLILACATCNQFKGSNFDLIGTKAIFVNTETNIRNINNLGSQYDIEEKPKMINPEVTNPSGKILFEKSGLVSSNDNCFSYTINTCRIDRKYLNDARRSLLDIFERDIRSALIDNNDPTDQKKEIATIVRKFIRDSQDSELQFLGFRRFAISSGWLNDITKNLN